MSDITLVRENLIISVDDCNQIALDMTIDEIREFKDKLWWSDYTFIENLIGRADWKKIFREFREEIRKTHRVWGFEWEMYDEETCEAYMDCLRIKRTDYDYQNVQDMQDLGYVLRI